MTHRRRAITALFAAAIAAVYLLMLWRLDWLRFPVDRDEAHFWPTTLEFSHSLLRDLQTLRDYPELNTPLPFLVFGAIEHVFRHSLILSRYLMVMSITPIAWDKYALPLLCVLWLLRAAAPPDFASEPGWREAPRTSPGSP